MLQGIAILLHLGSGLPGTGLASVLCLLSPPGLDEASRWVGQEALACRVAPLLDHHIELIQGETNLLPVEALFPQ